MRVTVARSFSHGKFERAYWADDYPGFVTVLRSVYEDRTEYHTIQYLLYHGTAWQTNWSIDRGAELTWYVDRWNWTEFRWENTSVIMGLRLRPGTHTYRE